MVGAKILQLNDSRIYDDINRVYFTKTTTVNAKKSENAKQLFNVMYFYKTLEDRWYYYHEEFS